MGRGLTEVVFLEFDGLHYPPDDAVANHEQLSLRSEGHLLKCVESTSSNNPVVVLLLDYLQQTLHEMSVFDDVAAAIEVGGYRVDQSEAMLFDEFGLVPEENSQQRGTFLPNPQYVVDGIGHDDLPPLVAVLVLGNSPTECLQQEAELQLVLPVEYELLHLKVV